MVNKPANQLVAGVDYPRNFVEFQEFFPNEAAAYRYLEQLRWPEGLVCLRCGENRKAWRSARGLLVCSACRKQTSVTAGTVFEKTAQAATTLVPRRLGDHEQQARSQCSDHSAKNRPFQLQDSVVMVAQISACHGPPRSGSPCGRG